MKHRISVLTLSVADLERSLSVIPVDTAAGYKLETVMKGIAVVPGGLGTNTIALAINKGAWKKISAADRAAIAALSGEVLSQQAGTAQKGGQGLRCVQGRRHQCGADDGRGRRGTGRRSCACPLHLGRGCKSRGLADPETVLKEHEAEIGMI